MSTIFTRVEELEISSVHGMELVKSIQHIHFDDVQTLLEENSYKNVGPWVLIACMEKMVSFTSYRENDASKDERSVEGELSRLVCPQM
jgi:hypothetical protein